MSVITKRDDAVFTRRIASEEHVVIEYDIGGANIGAPCILYIDDGEGWIVGLGQLLFDF